ncbi:7TM GPCR Srsx domain containing protein [Trichuris trichiura]|uniref:7TM GPCR Srsx domain containing protein n=1 Tax=Trichuris trichiura TaxID=36087 RepID=A0A077Z7H8_TRITR|nr:7TM GPCR Srsx domain containing protein [Trichuris trichiura]
MIAMSVNDLLTGMSYFILELRSLLNEDESQKHDYTCCSKSALLSFCNNNALMSAVALSVDRTVAVCQPLFYRNVSIYKFHVPLTFLSTSYSVALSMVIAVQGYQKPIPFNRCGPELCWNSWFAVHLLQHLNMVLAFSIFFLNLSVIIYSRYTAKKYQRRNLIQLFHIKYDEQTRVMKTLTWVTLMVVTLQIVGRTLRLLSLQANTEISYTIFYNSFHVSTTLNAALNFFVVALTSASFRAALREIFIQSSVVSPF